jgi:hypothetical protein
VTKDETVALLVKALGRIRLRATPHVDDTDEDRRRDLYLIYAIAEGALRETKEAVCELSPEA